MKKGIYISPSTQEHNVGAGSYGTEEKRMNEIADVVEITLKKHGQLTFRNKPSFTLTEVVHDSNAKNPKVHIAIHSNAGGGGKARGCEVYCHKFGTAGERLAKSIYSNLSAITPSADRGVKEGQNYFGKGKPLYETAKTTAVAVLIEVAFHDSPEDAKWIVGNIKPIGLAIAKGILSYLKVK
ncbi:MAG: N-acetylmuramoyl-L-alanine amidase [Bacillota bacterium]